MPRKKTFVVDEALEKVIEVFRERGYQDTSVQVIADHLGLSRSSIYLTFGDKQDLFVKVLRRNGAEFQGPGLSELGCAVSPRAALVKAFELAVAGGNGKSQHAGCLLLDSVIGQDHHTDPEIGRIVETANEGLERRFREAIERGQGAAEIAADINPAHTARVLLSQYLGVRVLLRSGAASEPVLDAVLLQVEALLPVPLAEAAEKP